ncbi:MAG TPA: hypothetical protein VMV19_17555 [Xanthobacteraceae bacterium]|nr:hypothetical protein [Xanthobacteraceae bacterium]
MASVSEAAGARTELAGDLAIGVDTLSLLQEVTFVQYTKVILPLDQFVFWVRADLLSAAAIYNAALYNAVAYGQPPTLIAAAPTLIANGSLHWANAKRQDETETIAVNQVVFTSEVEITDLNAVGPHTIYIATLGAEGVRYAFSQRRSFYRQAMLYHYIGIALYPALASQIVDDVALFDSRQPVVSNSLPLWLALNSYQPIGGGLSLPTQLYPSFAVPDNLPAPYGVVHIDPEQTAALQPVPYLGRTLSHHQLMQDKVRVTLYGLRNADALGFLDAALGYMAETDNLGLMNGPAVRDAKRPQAEFSILAMEKTIDFEVSYDQATARNVARQLITSAIPTYLPQPTAYAA